MSSGVDNVSVTHCTMVNPIQGVTSWAGSYWEISHNVITDLRTALLSSNSNAGAGGVGIIIGARTDAQVSSNNVLSHNTISGTFHVVPCEDGNHVGAGISLFGDLLLSEDGTIANNRVVKNKISLVSDCVLPFVPAHGIALDQNGPGAIIDNAIGFNDLRGTVSQNEQCEVFQIYLSPLGLDNPMNDISRNLGNNRGHGLHPSVFGPGGN